MTRMYFIVYVYIYTFSVTCYKYWPMNKVYYTKKKTHTHKQEILERYFILQFKGICGTIRDTSCDCTGF